MSNEKHQAGPCSAVDDMPVEADMGTGMRRIVSPRKVGRPAKAESFRPMLVRLLEISPEMTTRELLDEVLKAGYSGGKTALYSLVAKIRDQRDLELDVLPGQLVNVEICDAMIAFASDEKRRVTFVVSRLAYSESERISILWNDNAESVARAMLSHFEFFGGVPLLARFEKPRLVANVVGEQVEWDWEFAQFAAQLGIAVELRKGTKKALGLGRGLREQLESRVFATMGHLADEVANKVMHPPHPSRPLEERKKLRPMPSPAHEWTWRSLAPTDRVAKKLSGFRVQPD